MNSTGNNLKLSTKFEEACKLTIRNFVIDEDNCELIEDLKKYIDREEGNLDPDRGLLIMGNAGSGKTELLKSLQLLYRVTDHPLQFKFKNIPELVQEYSLDGYSSMIRYKKGNWLLDELAMLDQNGKRHKEFAKYSIDVGDALIHQCYLKFQTGGMFHFTTNCNDEELQSVYHSSTYSRLRGMCNFVALVGPDRRPNSAVRTAIVKSDTKEVTEEEKKKSEEDFISEFIIKPFQKFVETDELILQEPIITIYEKLEEKKILLLTTDRKNEIYEKAKLRVKAKNWNDQNFRTRWNPDNPDDETKSKIQIESKRIATYQFFTECKEAGINIEDLINNQDEQ